MSGYTSLEQYHVQIKKSKKSVQGEDLNVGYMG